ncbi:MAG: helicase-associated domain-containing protein [Chloroflexota bacterium]
MRLEQCLKNSDPAVLRRISARLVLSDPLGLGEAELARRLGTELLRGPVIEAILGSLSPQGRNVLVALLENGGALPGYRFLRQYGGIRRPNPLAADWRGVRPGQAPGLSPAEELWLSGLVYKVVVTDEHHAPPSEQYLIPEDLISLLPPADSLRPAFQVETAPPPSTALPAHEVLLEITLLLCLLQREKVPAEGGSAAADAARLFADELFWTDPTAPDPELAQRFGFLLYLLKGLGVVEDRGGWIKPARKALAWLRLPAERRFHSLWNCYLKDQRWDEISRLPRVAVDYRRRRPDLARARRRLADQLGVCPANSWIPLEPFTAAIKETAPDLLRWDYSAWKVTDRARGTLYLGWDSWEHLERAYVVELITKYLHWLGLVSLGLAGSEPSVFQITPAGATLVRASPREITESPHEPITVLSNFEIMVPSTSWPAAIFQVERLAQLIRRDRISLYRLTRESVQRCLEQGARIEGMISFLRQASASRLPQNVAHALHEWATGRGHIAIERTWVLSTGGPGLLEELRANREVALEGEALGPQAVAVPERELAALVRRLRKAGYFPELKPKMPSP